MFLNESFLEDDNQKDTVEEHKQQSIQQDDPLEVISFDDQDFQDSYTKKLNHQDLNSQQRLKVGIIYFCILLKLIEQQKQQLKLQNHKTAVRLNQLYNRNNNGDINMEQLAQQIDQDDDKEQVFTYTIDSLVLKENDKDDKNQKNDQIITQTAIEEIKQEEPVQQQEEVGQQQEEVVQQQEEGEEQKNQEYIKQDDIKSEDSEQGDVVEVHNTHEQLSTPSPTLKKLPYPKALESINIVDLKLFIVSPSPRGGMIQCTIKRERSGMARFYPKYHMHISNGYRYLMSAKKNGFNNTSNYGISMNRNELDSKNTNYLGKVRSNFMGTEFVFYDNGLNPKKVRVGQQCRRELGAGFYESNIMGSKGPRKMTVILPKVDIESEAVECIQPKVSSKGIINEYTQSLADKVSIYNNRQPKWNDVVQAFVLNFYGRVDKPSVKNFQLIHRYQEDVIYLQFGRVGEDIFNLDFQFPISPLQAFQIALSSFDYKLACE